jgi:trk system potassium uptake protein TrkH
LMGEFHSLTSYAEDPFWWLFEATSAYATMGLSMGLTPDLSPVGKVIIILSMFAGRLGPLTIAYAVPVRRNPDAFRYPKGKIMIG